MEILDFRLLYNILRVKLKIARLPLFISWSITNRCAYKCLYCMNWRRKKEELTLKQIFIIIDKLAQNGTKWISFTGGEPFLRDDLGEIVEYAVKNKILVSVNSSGYNITKNTPVLKNLNSLILSLDGPASIHNQIRQDDQAYERVMAAAFCAKETGNKVKFFTVINRLNMYQIDFLLENTRKLGCTIMFQFATPYKLRAQNINPIALSKQEYTNILEYLIKKKKTGYTIGNSFSGLNLLKSSSDIKPVRCWGGRFFFRIEPEGSLIICPRVKKNNELNCLTNTIESCINHLPPNNNCLQCLTAARIEFNCIFNHNLEALINFLKT